VHFQKSARPFGVTIERWRVLYVLMRRGDLRASQLSARTGIEASTLSHLLNRMARDDLVTRNREDGDGRAVRVGLTEAGRALAERMLPFALQYEAVALAGMDAAEAAQLKATLRRIAHNLEALDAVIVAPSRPSSD
jgi:DNA-binding MarR family transcriptional regulator